MKKLLSFALILALAFTITVPSMASTQFTFGEVTTVNKNVFDGFAATKLPANNTKTDLGYGTFIADNKSGWYLSVTETDVKGTLQVAYKIGSDYYIVAFNIDGPGNYWVGDGSGKNGVNMVRIGEFVREASLPGKPVDFEIAPRIGGLDMRWGDPVSGAPVDHYEIQINGGAWEKIGMPILNVGNVNDGKRVYSLTGLTGGETYTVAIRAVGADGRPGEASPTLEGIPRSISTPYGYDAQLISIAGNRLDINGKKLEDLEGGLTFANPARATIDYRTFSVMLPGFIIVSENATINMHPNIFEYMNPETDPYSIIEFDFNSGEEQTVYIEVTSSNREVKRFYLITLVRETTEPLPGKPENVSISPGINRLNLLWNDPASGAAVDSYEYKIDDGDWINIGKPAINTINDKRIYAIHNLIGGQEYTISLRAVDAGGNTGEAVTAKGTPNMRNPQVGFDAQLISILGQSFDIDGNELADLEGGTHWAVPGKATVNLSEDNAAVMKRQIGRSANASVNMYDYWDNPGQDLGLDIIYFDTDDKDNDQIMMLKITSQNGQTVLYYLITVVFEEQFPGKPENVTILPGIGTLTLTWEEPISGVSVAFYKIQFNDGPWQKIEPVFIDGLNVFTITGLLNNITEHKVSIRAVSIVEGIERAGDEVTVYGTPRPRNPQVGFEAQLIRMGPHTDLTHLKGYEDVFEALDNSVQLTWVWDSIMAGQISAAPASIKMWSSILEFVNPANQNGFKYIDFPEYEDNTVLIQVTSPNTLTILYYFIELIPI